MKFFQWVNRAARRSYRNRLAVLTRCLDDERSGHEATRRQLRVAQAECDALAAVVARDRARVEAETSSYTRQHADNEGLFNVRAR